MMYIVMVWAIDYYKGDFLGTGKLAKNFLKFLAIFLIIMPHQNKSRGSPARFMTKDLNKGIRTKSSTRNENFNWSTRENFTSFKRTKYKYSLITRKQKELFGLNTLLTNKPSNIKELVKLFSEHCIIIVENSSCK